MTNLVRLTKSGVGRTLRGSEGELYEVDHFTDSLTHGPNRVCHVRDYRHDNRLHNGKKYQVWTLGHGDWVPE